tara:strand:- start:8912 stop:9304 length:393 start_codon:yes stop_codon:yes gene_type:complete
MSEFQEQKTLIAWFRAQYPQYEKCIRLSLNGINLPPGKTAAIMINQMKSQGMVKSESDLFFAIPNMEYHGLFIEMKDFEKKATPEQQKYLDFMQSLQYEAAVCVGAEAAKEVITNYMKTSLIAKPIPLDS